LTHLVSNDFAAIKAAPDIFINYTTSEEGWWDPFALAARANASDNPKWHEAMHGSDSEIRNFHPNKTESMGSCSMDIKLICS